jgi:predicted RNA binding protein YcfA (HicA-like mRNA interferase family)
VKLPRNLSGADAAKALRRLGFEAQRQTGSHFILRRGSCVVAVPQHRPLKPGTLRGILEQSGLSLEELLNSL